MRIADCELRIAELEMGNAKENCGMRNADCGIGNGKCERELRNAHSAIRNTSKPWTALALAHNGANLLLGWREDHATSGSGPGSSNLLSSMPRSSIGEIRTIWF